MSAPAALLLIGVHREELEFGRGVAAAIDPAKVAVLEIPDGLSGRRPLPDEEFRYGTLHRELYRQILTHMSHSGQRLLIDLHAGRDALGPSADVICADDELRAQLTHTIERDEAFAQQQVRVIPLGGGARTHARTVIPRELWQNSDFRYLALEIYLPESAAGCYAARMLAQWLIERVAQCVPEPHSLGIHSGKPA